MELPQTEEFRRLFVEDIPLLDVRAPVEFDQGAFPLAENHPLINNAEREQIGIQYKHLGQDAAIDLGHELVQGETRAARIAEWQAFVESHPNAILYCFRGGMRSKISQQWLYEQSGLMVPRVKGGYKALRRFLIDELEVSAGEVTPIVLGGRTGVGKTQLLQQLTPMLDLERLAWHRGSAFGYHATPPPTQIGFENALSIALIKLRAAGQLTFVVEDEHRNVGRCFIPDAIRDRFRESPLVVLEVSNEERVANTLQEYVIDAQREYYDLYGEEEGFAQWCDYMLGSLDRIKKRLGGVRHRELRAVMEEAIAEQRSRGTTAQHAGWIEPLLLGYYDPMYDYQITSNEKYIVLKADRAGVLAYLAEKGICQIAD